MELTHADFLAFVPFSQNVANDTLQPFVKDALLMEVMPLLNSLTPEAKAQVLDGTLLFTDEFENDVLKGFWVVQSFDKMVQVHGINVTGAGVTKTKGESYDQASDTERGRVQAYLRSKKSYFEAELRKAIAPYTLETTTCKNTRSSSIGMYVGKRK